MSELRYEPAELANLAKRRELQDFARTETAKAIVMLLATGFESAEITRQFKLDADSLSYLIKETSLKEVYDMYDIANSNDENLMKRLSKVAIRIKAAILLDPQTPMRVRNEIATEIIERVHGKPCQSVKTYVSYDIDSSKSLEELDKKLKSFGVNIEELARSEEAAYELVSNE